MTNELRQFRERRDRRRSNQLARRFMDLLVARPFFAVIVDENGEVRLYQKGMDADMLNDVQEAIESAAV